MKKLMIVLALAGCGEPLTTPEGCTVMYSEAGQAMQQACQQAYYEAQARAQGKPVTRCFGQPGAMTCTTQ